MSKWLDAIENLSAFARENGLDRRMLDRYRAGMEPSISNASKIAKALGITLDELVQGKKDAQSDANDQVDDSIALPMLSVYASAGDGHQNQNEHVISHLPFSRTLLRELGVQPELCHFIRAHGTSMEPTIREGAIVLVDLLRKSAREDGIYVLMYGDDARIKRLHFSALGGLTLKSDNEAFPQETISRADIDQIKIVGKVVWVGGVV